MNTPLLLTGIGLRSNHYVEFIEKKPSVAWVEVHSENFFGENSKALHVLEKVRQDYPISLHGVGLSLGSADELNWQHLKKLNDLIKQINPCLISEHLSWSSISGQYFHDLLPLPYTEETLQYMITRIQQIQDYLQRQILIENISSYLEFQCSTLTETEFLNRLAKHTGCGILLDVNNIYVTAANLTFDPYNYLASIEPSYVHEIHLAGFSISNINGKEILIDTHDHPIVPAVWDLYRYTLQHLGHKPTIIEWDANLPSLDSLFFEAYRAEKIMREAYVPTKHTN